MNDSIPPQAITLIQSFESCRLTAYQDGRGTWTCGWGSTGSDIGPGTVWTQDYADHRLIEDVTDACDTVRAHVTVTLTDNELSALTSFVYNVGYGDFVNSTLLKMLNQGFYQQVPVQLMRWNHIGQTVSFGLTRRRTAECRLWNLADPSSA